MPALSHAPKDPDHWADLVSTCTWTRHILALHAGDARRACRARFDETAAELAAMQATGEADAGFLDWAGGLDKRMSELLLELRQAGVDSRVDSALRGLRLLEDLNNIITCVLQEPREEARG